MEVGNGICVSQNVGFLISSRLVKPNETANLGSHSFVHPAFYENLPDDGSTVYSVSCFKFFKAVKAVLPHSTTLYSTIYVMAESRELKSLVSFRH